MLTNHHHQNRRQQDITAVRQRLSVFHPASDDLDYGMWAERIIKSSHNSFGRRQDHEPKIGPWARGMPRPDPCELAGSRALMIAGYRQEMMDLVRNMPDEGDGAAAYELSLRDIVETPTRTPTPTPAKKQEEGVLMMEEKKRREENEEENSNKNKARSKRSRFLLKSFGPKVRAAVGGRRILTSGRCVGGAGKGSKVSPKPATDGESSERSSSSRSSNRGGRDGDGGHRRTWIMRSCYALLNRARRRSTEI